MPRGWGRAATQRARVGGASIKRAGGLSHCIDEDDSEGHEEGDDGEGDL